jgi:carbon monoxide dehydrogenase subunit G
MPTLHFTTAINAPPQAVFDRLADFAHYDDWLPSSSMFKSVSTVSDNPVKLGSTYVDKNSSSIMYGKVTAYEPPQKITFHQVTHIKALGLDLAGLEITITYQLAASGSGTNLTRDVIVQGRGLLTLIQARLLPGIAAENHRILAALKSACERSAGSQ